MTWNDEKTTTDDGGIADKIPAGNSTAFFLPVSLL